MSLEDILKERIMGSKDNLDADRREIARLMNEHIDKAGVVWSVRIVKALSEILNMENSKIRERYISKYVNLYLSEFGIKTKILYNAVSELFAEQGWKIQLVSPVSRMAGWKMFYKNERRLYDYLKQRLKENCRIKIIVYQFLPDSLDF